MVTQQRHQRQTGRADTAPSSPLEPLRELGPPRSSQRSCSLCEHHEELQGDATGAGAAVASTPDQGAGSQDPLDVEAVAEAWAAGEGKPFKSHQDKRKTYEDMANCMLEAIVKKPLTYLASVEKLSIAS